MKWNYYKDIKPVQYTDCLVLYSDEGQIYYTLSYLNSDYEWVNIKGHTELANNSDKWVYIQDIINNIEC